MKISTYNEWMATGIRKKAVADIFCILHYEDQQAY